MPAPNAISTDKLARIIGTPRSPVILDVRSETDFATDPRLVPGPSVRMTANLPICRRCRRVPCWCSARQVIAAVRALRRGCAPKAGQLNILMVVLSRGERRVCR